MQKKRKEKKSLQLLTKIPVMGRGFQALFWHTKIFHLKNLVQTDLEKILNFRPLKKSLGFAAFDIIGFE